MRKLISILAAVLITETMWAQIPQKMSYQAVIRDASNKLVTSQKVGMRVSILQGSASGKPIYTETQTPTTNANGLVNIEIGGGAGFDAINWANKTYFIKTQTDPTGETNYTITGTSQLLSVPYALYAKTATGISGKLTVSQIGDFQSGLLPPSATTQLVSNLQSFSATLNGKVNAKNLSTTVIFEWGLTKSYGNEALAVQNPVTGTSDVAVTANLTGLQLPTIYHYRIKAVNAVNVTYGGDMLFSTLVVNVKSTGATGDGSTDDTKAIQTAIDSVAGTYGTVLVPAGTYMIDATTGPNRNVGVKLGNNMTFRMESGAVLKAIPNGEPGYYILFLEGKSNVNIIGGTLQGERSQHKYGPGTNEFGMGIFMAGSHEVYVEGVTAKDVTGDGFFIGYGSRNITIDSITSDNNRRQGMSIVSVDSIVVKNSTFKYTYGTPPAAGIDIEPGPGEHVDYVLLLNNQFLHNGGSGLIIADDNRVVTNVIVSGNTFLSNVDGAVRITNGTNTYSFTNNIGYP